MSKRYDITDEDVLNAWNDGLTLNAISRKFACSVDMVMKRLTKQGITDFHSRSNGASRHYASEADSQWCQIKADLDAGHDINFLKNKYHMTKKRLYDLFTRQGYDYNANQALLKNAADDLYKNQLQTLRSEGKSVKEIAEIVGKSERTVSRHMMNFGITKKVDRTDISDSEILKLWNDGLTVVEIARSLDCSHDTVTKRLNNQGIVTDRVSGIKRHFERTHDELWNDIRQDLDYGCSTFYISRKYKIRQDNVDRLMSKHNYVAAENAGYESLLSELMCYKSEPQCQSSRCQRYIDIIEQYYRKYQDVPSVKDLAEFTQFQSDTVRYNIVRCGLCRFVKTATLNDYVARLAQDLDKLDVKYIFNNRTVLKDSDGHRMEIDIYIPDYQIGIEVNPVYTHSVDTPYGVDSRLYHQKKSLLAESCGVGLLHMYDDDFFDDRRYQVFLSQIKAKTIQRPKIGARQCVVKVIDNAVCNDFLDLYHFQGKINAKCDVYGLYYNDILIGVLAMTKPRYTNHDYEILRYCLHPEYIVTGGFEKLFHAFLRTLNVSATIVSYMDLNKRLSANNVYERCGFELDSITAPDYAWYHLMKPDVLSRYMTTKSKLAAQGYDSSKTEVEIMTERHYARVFRAGSKRYVYKYIV